MEQCIKTFLDKLCVSKQIVPVVPKKELLIDLLYFGKFLMGLSILLYKSVSKAITTMQKI